MYDEGLSPPTGAEFRVACSHTEAEEQLASCGAGSGLSSDGLSRWGSAGRLMRQLRSLGDITWRWRP